MRGSHHGHKCEAPLHPHATWAAYNADTVEPLRQCITGRPSAGKSQSVALRQRWRLRVSQEVACPSTHSHARPISGSFQQITHTGMALVWYTHARPCRALHGQLTLHTPGNPIPFTHPTLMHRYGRGELLRSAFLLCLPWSHQPQPCANSPHHLRYLHTDDPTLMIVLYIAYAGTEEQQPK